MGNLLDMQRVESIADEDRIEQIKALITGGSKKISVLITWLVYYLASHPRLLRRLREEIYAVVILDQEDVIVQFSDYQKLHLTEHHLSSLTYCAGVMKELFRLHSPVLCFPQEVDISDAAGKYKPVTLNNDFAIHPHEEVWINIEALMRDANIFTFPNSFSPERWSSEGSTAEQLRAMEAIFYPFGGERRIFSAIDFAEQELLVAIVYLSYFFQFELQCSSFDIQRVFEVVASADKMPVKVGLRKDFQHQR